MGKHYKVQWLDEVVDQNEVHAHVDGDGGDVNSEIRLVMKELCELFERDDIMARLRSLVDLLCKGDRNTTFFHAKAMARKRSNCITHLAREDGST
jgi:hypothetical protein